MEDNSSDMQADQTLSQGLNERYEWFMLEVDFDGIAVE